MEISTQKIVLFDGVCNLCNGAINFLIAHDPQGHFKMAALQSEIGSKLLEQYKIDPQYTDSIILIENNKAYVKSTAALQIVRKFNGAWPLLYGFIILPRFIRDAVYDFIAKNRYEWFGRKDSCMIPTPALKSRFL